MKDQCTKSGTEQSNRNRQSTGQRLTTCLLEIACHKNRYKDSRTKHGKHVLDSQDHHFGNSKFTCIVNWFI